ncbi:hypothetical protein D3C86_2016340 [compost metagenome]
MKFLRLVPVHGVIVTELQSAERYRFCSRIHNPELAADLRVAGAWINGAVLHTQISLSGRGRLFWPGAGLCRRRAFTHTV